MLELDASCLTSTPALKASAQAENFHDSLVEGVDTGDCYRADQVLADTLK